MNGLNEREILERMRTLAATSPATGEIERAIRAARRTLIWRHAARWTAAGAVAAALLLVAALLIARPRTATAADALTQAAERSKDFKGWVHMKISEQADRPAAPNVAYAVRHFNTETGVWAQEAHGLDGGLEVTMCVPREKKEVDYSSKSGEVKIGDLNADFAQSGQKEVERFPLTAAAFWAKQPNIGVRESQDGDLLRYDFTFPKEELTPKEREQRGDYPASCIAWADSRTKLVTKVESKFGDSVITQECTYGGREVRDVYDIGVPRDARIVDLRVAGDLQSVVARLEKRQKEGYGDFAAVETTTDINADGTPEPSRGSVWIYGRKGEKYLTAQFLFGDRTNSRGIVDDVKPPRPAGWPTPDIAAVLDTVQGRLPGTFLVSDGRTVWTGEGEKSDKVEEQPMQGVLSSTWSLSGHLWPNRSKLGLFGTDAKGELIADTARLGLIAVRVERLGYGGTDPATGQIRRQKELNVNWIDPGKDDLPVETLDQTYSPDGLTIESESHRTYQDLQQTADGRWYPATWKRVTTFRLATGRERASTVEGHLKVWSGKTLGDEWFGDLSKRGSQ